MEAIALSAHLGTSEYRITSNEIAEVTGKEHRNVMRDIRNQLDALGIDALKFERIYKDAYGREKPCFVLDLEQAITLYTGYDIPTRNRMVQRWGFLEQQAKKEKLVAPVPTTLSDEISEEAKLVRASKARTEALIEFLEDSADLEIDKETKKEIRFRMAVTDLNRHQAITGSVCESLKYIQAAGFGYSEENELLAKIGLSNTVTNATPVAPAIMVACITGKQSKRQAKLLNDLMVELGQASRDLRGTMIASENTVLLKNRPMGSGRVYPAEYQKENFLRKYQYDPQFQAAVNKALSFTPALMIGASK